MQYGAIRLRLYSMRQRGRFCTLANRKMNEMSSPESVDSDGGGGDPSQYVFLLCNAYGNRTFLYICPDSFISSLQTKKSKIMDRRRFFNTTGPCNPERHYMLPPEDRLKGAQLHRYIKDELYWVLHAPRQTGKTTFLQSWAREINAGRDAVACYVSVERCQEVPEPERAMPAICNAVREYARMSELAVPEVKTDDPSSMLSDILINWSALVAPKSLIVLFDEVDVLVDHTLVSFLRQLRGG
ncbi:MAG: hypothetical protein LBG96_14550, partial [Tannerella sp.]|nr:hypothetical protein [Tannerella sp.]